MLQEGDKVRIKPNKLAYYKMYAYSFMELDSIGTIYQVMEQTVVVMYGNIGYNIDKNDLYIVERWN